MTWVLLAALVWALISRAHWKRLVQEQIVWLRQYRDLVHGENERHRKRTEEVIRRSDEVIAMVRRKRGAV